MISNFSFVVPNVVAGSAYPKGNAEEVVREVKSLGIRTVINLTEAPHPAAEAMTAAGIHCMHIPIADFRAPTIDDMRAVAETVTDPTSLPVLIHCRAGIGRTGTMLAVAVAALKYKKLFGMEEVDDCVAYVRSLRGGALEVGSQMQAYLAFERILQAEYLQKPKI